MVALFVDYFVLSTSIVLWNSFHKAFAWAWLESDEPNISYPDVSNPFGDFSDMCMELIVLGKGFRGL